MDSNSKNCRNIEKIKRNTVKKNLAAFLLFSVFLKKLSMFHFFFLSVFQLFHGSKHTPQCSKDACDFFARIIENFTPNSVPKVEIAGKIKRNSYE